MKSAKKFLILALLAPLFFGISASANCDNKKNPEPSPQYHKAEQAKSDAKKVYFYRGWGYRGLFPNYYYGYGYRGLYPNYYGYGYRGLYPNYYGYGYSGLYPNYYGYGGLYAIPYYWWR